MSPRFTRLKTRTYFNDPPAVPPVPPPPPAPVTFTQEQVNAFLKKEREKDQAAAQKEKSELITQLETLKASKGLSAQEKQDLEARIEQLSTQHMTEQQKLQAALDKVSKESKTTIEALTGDSKKWQGEFQRLLITQGITAGAIQHKAADPTGEQLGAMLLPRAKVVEKVDDAGQPTGVYEAVLPVSVLDPKTKKPVVVELPVVEAIGKLREDPKNANLFLIEGKPGFGGSNGGPGGNGKPAFDPNMSPADYRKHRKEIIG